MHDHRSKIDDSCSMCHGKLEFGREGGNFCANPACHGRSGRRSTSTSSEVGAGRDGPGACTGRGPKPAKATPDKAMSNKK